MPDIDLTFYCIALMIVSGAILYWRKAPLNFIASIMSQIGILGTFLGIIMALWSMDSQNVSDGVPHLLGGMKTAFVSSAVGVFFALILKMIAQNRESQQSTNPIDLLQQINQSLVDLNRNNTDGFSSLNQTLQQFTSDVGESNSKALVDALEELTVSFNDKLTTEFGENFAQLNVAVEKMLVWQQQHQKQVESTHQLITAFQQLFEDLPAKIEELNTHIRQVSEHSSSSANSIEQLVDHNGEFVQQMQETVSIVQNSIGQLNALSVLLEQTALLEQGSQTTLKNLQALPKEMQSQLLQSQNTMHDEMRAHFREIDRQLEQELNKALQTLGNQLASLSEKFVEDYQPLTERLREVVQISKGL